GDSAMVSSPGAGFGRRRVLVGQRGWRRNRTTANRRPFPLSRMAMGLRDPWNAGSSLDAALAMDLSTAAGAPRCRFRIPRVVAAGCGGRRRDSSYVMVAPASTAASLGIDAPTPGERSGLVFLPFLAAGLSAETARPDLSRTRYLWMG